MPDNDNVFDFSAFMKKAANPDDETTHDLLREAVQGEMDGVMAEVAPRIWAVVQEQMAKNPHDNVYLNAVINSLIFSTLAWVCCCSPNNDEGNDALRRQIVDNLDHAIANSRDQGPQMSYIAHNEGRLKLSEDAVKDIAHVLTQNSRALVGVAEAIRQSKSD